MPYWYDRLAGGEDITATRITAEVTNADSVTLVRGDVVYLFGATGNRASVKLASAVGDITSSTTFGIVEDTIAPNNVGTIVNQGVIDQLNLTGYNPGDSVWLSTTAGDFTNVKPVAPIHTVFLGVVERANAGNGQIYVKVQNGYELGELHNVLTNGATTDQVLTYDGTTSLWTHRDTNHDRMAQALAMSSSSAEVFPRGYIGGASAASSGEVFLSFFEVPKTVTVSSVSMSSSNTVASGITLIRMGLYQADASGNVTLVARCAVNNTLFTSSQVVYTQSFDTAGGYPANYTLVPGTRYALGHIVVATTRPTLIHNFLTHGKLQALSPRITGSRTGQTDLPTTLNAPGNGGTEYVDANRSYWGRFQ